jgi:IPT/TIG domain
MIAEAQVALFDVYPASGPAGAEVTLTGSGFTADNSIYFGPGAIAHVPITSSIGIACTADPNCRGGIKQMLVFTVPSELPPSCPPQPARCSSLPRETAPGEYHVRVENENARAMNCGLLSRAARRRGHASNNGARPARSCYRGKRKICRGPSSRTRRLTGVPRSCAGHNSGPS